MKRSTILLGILSLSLIVVGPLPAQDKPLDTDAAKASYGIGLNIGRSLKRDAIDIDTAILLQGINDALDEKEPKITQEEFLAALKEMQTAAVEKSNPDAAKNREAGEAFLAKNKQRPEVKTTASGLQYEVIEEGEGATPKETDLVKTHYKGTLLSGKEFDSSYGRGEAAVFPVNRVIDGWTEALQLMKVGGKWKLYIPSDLAYGVQGAGADIGPNETLVFEIELLGIEEPQN